MHTGIITYCITKKNKKMIVYVKSSAFKDKCTKHGIMECSVLTGELFKNQYTVSDQSNNLAKVELKDMFLDKEMTRPVKEDRFTVSGIDCKGSKEGAVKIEGNVYEGKIFLRTWNEDLNHCIIEVAGQTADMNHISKIYPSKKALINDIGVTVHNLDGTEEEIGGFFKRCSLSDEDFKLIDDVKHSVEKCLKAGIKLGYNVYENRLYAVKDKDELLTTDTTYDKDPENVLPADRYIVVCGDISELTDEYGYVLIEQEQEND